MKKQSILRILIVAMIISAAFFVMATTSTVRESNNKEDCTTDQACEKETRSEFFLESLTRNLLTK